ncbi:hypothetical protein BKG83_16055 [Mycobacteroides chelonae]|uniref:Polyketide cyclase n=1 Tax=Mycobacteroides chelonae TaxID=1774 RepID=A0A1S1LS54_MYCCH|nr:SRPBCC family protein [Mycobacteroides chelonae]OHU55730.1 hypothetical protein BKG83_16055 [Mycobacteroides chelonae]OHU73241.1 hypothetical protein BKG84_28500 [Mycobacteroides chelonae]PKQ58159.1 hypothetical protein B5566_09590 [Mycobacterium sp. MHSD3]
MVEVRTVGAVDRPPAEVFAYVSDFRRMTEWVFGITRVESVGQPEQGLGAVYEGAVDLGPKTLSSTAKVTRWEQDQLITVDSVAGFNFNATVRLKPDGVSRTRLDFELNYAHSGGIAARALGKTIEPLLAMAARHTTAKLCDSCMKAAS